MFKKLVILLVLVYLPAMLIMMTGCEEEQAPKVTFERKDSYISTPPKRITYKSPITYSSPKPLKSSPMDRFGVPADWIPPHGIERKWTAIVLHHSASLTGSASVFDDFHRNQYGWEGVGYDFVIGNGHGSGDGEVEVTFRWTRQKTGAHCKTSRNNWANEKAVGICLVGNFNNTRPTPAQMAAAVKLVKYIQNRYNIPNSRVYGHNTTPFAVTKTDCPGKLFPMSRLKGML